MPRALRMAENMMRSARVDELPSCLLKQFDEFCAFHGVYYTHFSYCIGRYRTASHHIALYKFRNCTALDCHGLRGGVLCLYGELQPKGIAHTGDGVKARLAGWPERFVQSLTRKP